LQSSRRRTPQCGPPLTRSARPSRVAQPSLSRGRSIVLTATGGSNPDADFMPLECKPWWPGLHHDSPRKWSYRSAPHVRCLGQPHTSIRKNSREGCCWNEDELA
jgi:hypothetical protein